MENAGKLVRSDDGQDLIEYGLLVGHHHHRRDRRDHVDRTEGEDIFRQPQRRDAIGRAMRSPTSKRRSTRANR